MNDFTNHSDNFKTIDSMQGQKELWSRKQHKLYCSKIFFQRKKTLIFSNEHWYTYLLSRMLMQPKINLGATKHEPINASLYTFEIKLRKSVLLYKILFWKEVNHILKMQISNNCLVFGGKYWGISEGISYWGSKFDQQVGYRGDLNRIWPKILKIQNGTSLIYDIGRLNNGTIRNKANIIVGNTQPVSS